MVNESRLVSVYSRVDDDVIVDGEEKGVMALPGHIRIARIGLRRSEALTRVLDEPYAGRDGSRGERTEALHGRRVDLERELA